MFAAVPVSIHSLPLFLAQLQACLQKAHIPTIVILMATHQVFISMLVHLTSITPLRVKMSRTIATVRYCGLRAGNQCMHACCISGLLCIVCVTARSLCMQCWRRLKDFRDRKFPTGEHIGEALAWETLYEFEEHTWAAELHFFETSALFEFSICMTWVLKLETFSERVASRLFCMLAEDTCSRDAPDPCAQNMRRH